MSFLPLLLDELEGELEAAVVLRHELHADPELGHQEERTSARIAAALPIPAEAAAGTGLLARVSGRGRHTVAVRAELDGLPVTERTGARFRSENGAMHACGHDVHMAAAVALTRAAHRLRERIPVDLLAIFQPSEELDPSGARMLAEGELRGAPINAAVGAHVHPGLAWGTVALEPGPINASADTVEIEVTGASTHGAYPHQGRDPILALASIVVSLHSQVGRALDPLRPGVITVGTIQAGTTVNVIPDSATAGATLRAFDPEDRETLATLVERVAVDVAAAHGCEAKVTIRRGEPALDNDPRIVAAAVPMLARAGLERSPAWRSCGADDFSFFGGLFPIAMGFVGLAGHPGFTGRPLHHPELLVPDAAVGQVARTLAVMFCAAADGLEAA